MLALTRRYMRCLVALGHWHPMAVLVVGALAMRLLDELFGLPGRWLPELAAGGPQARIASMPMARAVFEVALLGPVVETALFQALPILASRKWTRLSAPWVLGISALAFGAVHLHYNLLYGLTGIAVGWVLASVYLGRLRGNGWAFWLTFGIHAIHNGTEILILRMAH